MWTPTTRAVIVPWVLLAALAAAALLYLRFAPPTPPTYVSVPGPTQYVPVPVKVAGKEKVIPGPPQIRYVPVEVVREVMKWPEVGADNATGKDNTTIILAVGEVSPHKGKTSVAAESVMEDNVLVTRLVMQQQPVPLFDLKRQGRLGAFVGTGGAFRGEATVLPFRTGPVEWVGQVSAGSADGRSEFRAWVGAEMTFGF